MLRPQAHLLMYVKSVKKKIKLLQLAKEIKTSKKEGNSTSSILPKTTTINKEKHCSRKIHIRRFHCSCRENGTYLFDTIKVVDQEKYQWAWLLMIKMSLTEQKSYFFLVEKFLRWSNRYEFFTRQFWLYSNSRWEILPRKVYWKE